MNKLDKYGKARYQVSLTPDRVERFKSVCRLGGLPPSTMSHAFDDFLRDILPVMEKATVKGSFSVMDFFHLLGEQVVKLQEEEVSQRDKIGTEKKGKRTSN